MNERNSYHTDNTRHMDGERGTNHADCAHYWQPQPIHPNKFGQDEGMFELLEDSGLFTQVYACKQSSS